MVKGDATDGKVQCADRVLYMDEEGFLHCHLKKRKHRQGGSDLRAGCRCADPLNPRRGFGCCFTCWTRSYLSKFNNGDTMWCFQPSLVQSRVKEALATLGVPRAHYVSFKSWRAGRATQMAQCGLSLADILTAGEWRSIAFARYCLTDKVIINPVGVLDSTLRNEADEDDGEVPAECTRTRELQLMCDLLKRPRPRQRWGQAWRRWGWLPFQTWLIAKVLNFLHSLRCLWRKACSHEPSLHVNH